MTQAMTERERFLKVMEYEPVDRVPHHEVGAWQQALDRWAGEGMPPLEYGGYWFPGEPAFGMDHREFVPVNYGMVPPFESKVLERDDKYEVIQDGNGVVRRALIEGTSGGMRMSMDTYLSWPVSDVPSFRELKKRYVAALPERYPEGWRDNIEAWRNRDHVLVLARNCSTLGFYWRAREWMGTENLSYALCMQPELIEEMMEFVADFTIEVSRPMLEAGLDPDYLFINEDLAMKTGPLIGPEMYERYIFPHMKRLVEFHKQNGVKYVVVDTDGNPEPLLSLFMDAGVDGVWPFERASENTNPHFIRRKYGRDLRIWGAVDKRELAKDYQAIDDHLRDLAPLLEEGGFIPTVDHAVPPDVSYDNLKHYMERKQQFLAGDFWW